MKKVWAPLAMVALAAGFASRYPDGLEKVARLLGFAGRGHKTPALLSGYAAPWFGHSKLSMMVAGMAGVLILFGVFKLGVVALGNKRGMADAALNPRTEGEGSNAR